MKFNSQHYFELEKKLYLDQLTVQEKQELSKYGILVEHEVFWNSRNEYIEMIKNFIDSKIDANEFTLQYIKLSILLVMPI